MFSDQFAIVLGLVMVFNDFWETLMIMNKDVLWLWLKMQLKGRVWKMVDYYSLIVSKYDWK
jgi:hypothetical protein